MESIKVAVERFEGLSASRRKSGHQDMEDAVSQLSSTFRLFELSNASIHTFARLKELLRSRLQPLYRIHLPEALNYAVAVLVFIHESKILPALRDEDNPSAASWEGLAVALLSGVLDFLEESSNREARRSVASAFYPILCAQYFSDPFDALPSYDGYLLSITYQLLLATLEAPGVDPVKLRDEAIGSRRLGLTIASTKDFLALEALLDLLGSLIPPLKHGKDARTKFLKEVFDPAIFDNSGCILQCLNNISSPDWSVTSVKIVHLLAESSLSFPQPFHVSGLKVQDTSLVVSSALYVDKRGFLANLDQDGKVDTLHILFSTVQNIYVQASDLIEADVLLKLSESPILGDQSMSVAPGDLSASWKIKKTGLNAFRKALMHRKVIVDLPAQRKLSIVNGLSLEFGALNHAKGSQELHKAKIEKLWAAASPDPRDNFEPTSPLLSQPTEVDAVADNLERISDEQPTAVFLDTSGNVSFQPPQSKTARVEGVLGSESERPPPILRTQMAAGEMPNLPAGIEPDQDEGHIDPKTRGTKPRKRKIISSDDEDGEPSVADTRRHQSKPSDTVPPPATKRTTRSKAAGRKAEAPAFIDIDAIQHPSEPVAAPRVKSKPTEPAKSRLQPANPEPAVAPPAPKNPSKKSSATPAIEGHVSKKRSAQDPAQNDAPPSKRTRVEDAPSSLPAPTRPVPLKKYGKKGRTSSPTPISSDVVDFDSPPKEPAKTRARAMKGKGGKETAKIKLIPVKKEAQSKSAKATKQPSLAKVKERTYPASDISVADISNAEALNIKQEARRSVRESTIQASTKSKGGAAHKTDTVPKKPSKAPWQRDSFAQKIENSSDISVQPSDLPNDVAVDELEEISDPVTPFDDDPSLTFVADNVSFEDKFEDFIEPTKGSASSSLPLPGRLASSVPQPSVVMIDLTESPVVVPKSKVSVPPKTSVRASHSFEKNAQIGDRTNVKSRKPEIIAPLVNIDVSENETTSTIKISRKTERSPSPLLVNGLDEEPLHSTPHLKVRDFGTDVRSVENMQPFREFKEERKIDQLIPRSRTPDTKPAVRIQPRPSVRDREPKIAQSTARLKPVNLQPGRMPSPPPRRISEKSERLEEVINGNFSLPNTNKSSHSHKQDNPLFEDVMDDERQPYMGGHQKRRPGMRPQEAEVDAETRMASVFNEISEVLIRKAKRRFTVVSKDLHRGQLTILQGAADNLREIYDESVRHYNALFDLHQDYTFRRIEMRNALAAYRKAVSDITQATKDVVTDHSRHSLCNKFPASIVPDLKSLPILSNPTISL